MLRIIFIINVTVVAPRVCVSVRNFLPPLGSRPRNIGRYIITATRKTLLYIIIVNFAENASFRSYERRHLLASNATNCS